MSVVVTLALEVLYALKARPPRIPMKQAQALPDLIDDRKHHLQPAHVLQIHIRVGLRFLTMQHPAEFFRAVCADLGIHNVLLASVLAVALAQAQRARGVPLNQSPEAVGVVQGLAWLTQEPIH